MLKQLLVKHVVSKIDSLLVNTQQLPMIGPGIVTVHGSAAVAGAGAVVPFAVDVEFVFADLISRIAGIFVLHK